MDTSQRLMEFFRTHPGPCCDACLAFALCVPRDAIARALGIVSQAVMLDRLRGTCAICQRQARLTLAILGNDAVEDRVLAALGDRRLCHTCLVGAVGADMPEVRKAVWRLRAEERARIAVAPCDGCQRPRVLVRAA